MFPIKRVTYGIGALLVALLTTNSYAGMDFRKISGIDKDKTVRRWQTERAREVLKLDNRVKELEDEILKVRKQYSKEAYPGLLQDEQMASYPRHLQLEISNLEEVIKAVKRQREEVEEHYEMLIQSADNLGPVVYAGCEVVNLGYITRNNIPERSK